MTQKPYRISVVIAVVLILLSSSCSTSMSSEVTDTIQALTETQTPTETQAPTETQTPTETQAPTKELTEDKINELSEQLICKGGTACIKDSRSNLSDPDPDGVIVDIVSSGVFENVELRNINTDENTGTLTVLKGVSKDKNGKPIFVQFVVQIELFSNPGINAFSGVRLSVLYESGITLDIEHGRYDIIDLLEWEKIMPEGSPWDFMSYRSGTLLPALEGTYYTTQEYNQALDQLAETKGVNFPAELIIVPFGLLSY